MLRRILFALLLVQLADLYLLVWLSHNFGFWETLTLTLGTGILGSALARREGVRVWRRWRAALQERRAPEEGMVDAMLVLIGGALLIAPGLITDVLALILLVPFTRHPLAAIIRRQLQGEFDRRAALAGRGRPVHVAEPGRLDSFRSSSDRPSSPESVIETTGVESQE
jgi:UPF0716 protein FxsA